jgi:hypothetical protein
MALNYGPPIYQAYIDAVQGRIKMQDAKLEMGLHAVELSQGIINIQNQMQERKAIADAYAQAQQPDQQGGQGGGTNPATGQPNVDPAEKTAAIYDKIAANISRFSPKLALEYSTKASTLRDQAMTRQKNALDIMGKQTDAIGKVFSAIQPGDQQGYTDALASLPPGTDISKFQLSGNVVQDWPRLQQIAKGTMSYKDNLEEAHRKVTEDQANLSYQEKVRYDSGRLGLEGANLNLNAQKVDLDKQWKSAEMDWHARTDARAAAGVSRTDAMDLAKSKDFAAKQADKGAPYIQSLIASDPDLSMLGDTQKKAVAQQLLLGAKAALSKQVTKPGDTVTADDFTREVNKLVPMAKKMVDPGKKGFFGTGIGAKDASLKGPLPQAIDTKEQFTALSVGDQFRKGDKMYKKTGPNQYEEIK